LKGSVDQGIQELKMLYRSTNDQYNHFKPEAQFLLAFIYLHLQKNKTQAWNTITDNQENYKENLVYYYVYGAIAMKTGHNDVAIEMLTNRPAGKDYLPFHFLNYITGLAKLHRLDSDAYAYFTQYLNSFKGENYLKGAFQKLAWHYLVNGDIPKYQQYMDQCMEQGNLFFDEDKQADKEANADQIPDIDLLKARLLFDGGYYDRSLEVLQKKVLNSKAGSKKDAIETNYRFARIWHEKGEIEKAISEYETTIYNSVDLPYYYAANSALQLGFIHEQTKDIEKARKYFRLALDLKDHEYENSIEQKAKTALKRIENL